ncbi:hypothetical protein G6F44_008811 [Rhizopus delemar]|nr:hypothetical protein G6F44_008811 [Rhizopus delemar]
MTRNSDNSLQTRYGKLAGGKKQRAGDIIIEEPTIEYIDAEESTSIENKKLEAKDSFEIYVEENSDDDFQPIVTARKRKSRENTPQSGLQERLKNKGKATDSEVTNTSSTGTSTTDEPTVFSKITLEDYDLEYSRDSFGAPVVKRPFLDELNKSASRITKSTSAAVGSSTTASKTSLTSPKLSKPVPTAFKSAATSIKSRLCPVPVDKASGIREGPKKMSKRVMTIKTTGGNSTRLKDTTKNYRQLISKYKEAYFEAAGYTPPPNLPYAQQIAFLHSLINKLFKKKEKTESLRGEMQANKSSSKAIKEAVQKKIYRPCNQMKIAIDKKEIPEVGLLDDQSRTKSNTSPKRHFKAFFRLAELSEAEQMKQFACFPLRITFIPCYMTLDSKIIHYHILKSKKNPKIGSKLETWGTVVDLNKKAFKHQGFQKSLRFQGTLETDGVSVSIIKQNTNTSRKSSKPNTEKKVDGNQTEHIEGLDQADLKSTEAKCVLLDPGRRDLMYCLKETSTVEEKRTLIFTKNSRSKCSGHFRYLRKCTQPFVIQKAEATLFRPESNSVNLEKFVRYIKTRASGKHTLYEYYGNESTKSKETCFPESEFDFRVDQKWNLYYENLLIARTRGFFPQLENYSTDNSIKSQLYVTYLQIRLQQKHIPEKLDDSEKSKALGLSKEITALETLQFLPFRKLKFSSKFFDQNDRKLVRSLKAKFGQDGILFFGDWSVPNVKYQRPTRSKGLIRMSKKNGLAVYLINEYKTSSHCPTCENEVEKFKTVPNLRPYQRKKKTDVLCNDLLSCQKRYVTHKALATMNMLSSIGMNPSDFSKLLCTRFYALIVRSQLEYGLAINRFTVHQPHALEGAQNSCIRKIYGARGKASTKVMPHMSKLPLMSERLHRLLPYVQCTKGHQWYLLSRTSLWKTALSTTDEPDTRSFKAAKRRFLQQNLEIRQQCRTSKQLSHCCRSISIDPILWLPMSKSERSRCIRWRLGWLPGGKPRPCPKHPMQQLSKNHVIN